ncbi:outer membrane protein [Ancylobacter sp. VNQ12]|uniref:outer membrane protein n=1 Tax=Ancylobacter sp. VNQ12 TaxID=3400920 RepID=UPI003C0F7CD3
MKSIAIAGAMGMLMISPTAAQTVDWGGWYVGGFGGYGHARENTQVTSTTAWASPMFFDDGSGPQYGIPDPITKTGNWTSESAYGPLWGGRAGYNWQSTNGVVIGIEAAIGSIDAAYSIHTRTDNGLLGSFYDQEFTIDWTASLRIRTGIANGRFLTYITSGVTFADVNYQFGRGEYGFNFERISFIDANDSYTGIGLSIGAGVEYAIDDNWSISTELTYTRFISENTYSALRDYFGTGTYNYSAADTTISFPDLRVGLNYRF